jgi:ribulose-phosphate 3-epimerase
LALVMSVEPGFGGQKFIPSALNKLSWLKSRLKPGTFASVDGGIDLETIAGAAAAGASLFVAGSAIFEAGDYGQALAELANRAHAPGAPR